MSKLNDQLLILAGYQYQHFENKLNNNESLQLLNESISYQFNNKSIVSYYNSSKNISDNLTYRISQNIEFDDLESQISKIEDQNNKINKSNTQRVSHNSDLKKIINKVISCPNSHRQSNEQKTFRIKSKLMIDNQNESTNYEMNNNNIFINLNQSDYDLLDRKKSIENSSFLKSIRNSTNLINDFQKDFDNYNNKSIVNLNYGMNETQNLKQSQEHIDKPLIKTLLNSNPDSIRLNYKLELDEILRKNNKDFNESIQTQNPKNYEYINNIIQSQKIQESFDELYSTRILDSLRISYKLELDEFIGRKQSTEYKTLIFSQYNTKDINEKNESQRLSYRLDLSDNMDTNRTYKTQNPFQSEFDFKKYNKIDTYRIKNKIEIEPKLNVNNKQPIGSTQSNQENLINDLKLTIMMKERELEDCCQYIKSLTEKVKEKDTNKSLIELSPSETVSSSFFEVNLSLNDQPKISSIKKNKTISNVKQHSIMIKSKELKESISKAKIILTYEGHAQAITALCLSKTNILQSASKDMNVKKWDVTNLRCVGTYSGHNDWVTSMILSSDGNKLCTGSKDLSIRIWDTSNNLCLSLIQAHKDSVLSLSLQGSNILQSSGKDRFIKAWNILSGECIQKKEAHKQSVNVIKVSQDGKSVYSGSRDNLVKIWDGHLTSARHQLSGHRKGVCALELNAEEDRLFSSGLDHNVRVWDLGNLECLQVLTGHRDAIRSLSLANSGQVLFSGSADQTLRAWDVSEGKCLKVINLDSEVNTVLSSGLFNKIQTGGSTNINLIQY